MDVIYPKRLSEKVESKCVLVVTDLSLDNVEIFPLRTDTTKMVLTTFRDQILKKYGMPKTIRGRFLPATIIWHVSRILDPTISMLGGHMHYVMSKELLELKALQEGLSDFMQEYSENWDKQIPTFFKLYRDRI